MEPLIERSLREILRWAQMGVVLSGAHQEICSWICHEIGDVLNQFEEGIMPDLERVTAIADKLEVAVKISGIPWQGGS